jgi:peptide/nickel transport system substrate-binding protein
MTNLKHDIPARSRAAALLVAATAAVMIATPVAAQKKSDTLRVAFTNQISTVLEYDDPQNETQLTTEAVFDGLMCFDTKSGELKPLLAAAWSEPAPRTIEIKLRPGIKFHDGSELTAADVAYTLRWVADPASKLRLANHNFSWVDHVEEIDKYTVRIATKSESPVAVLLLSKLAVLPARLHASYENKADFGRKTPVGTGPYKVVSFDQKSGEILARNNDYELASDCKPAARIGQVKIVPMPDVDAQLSALMVGDVDVVHTELKDQAEMARSVPTLEVSAFQGLNITYLSIDSINRAGNPALSDPRVRRAIAQSIDRQMIARSVLPGGSDVRPIDAPCVALQQGCVTSTKPPPYDAAGAKKLLAEAGYPNGFDVEITSTPALKLLAEAVGGEMRKIGIRASIDIQTTQAHVRKRRDGKEQMLVGLWPAEGLPDVSPTVDFFFTPDRDYWRDPLIDELDRQGMATIDRAKRGEIYRKLWDRVNEMSYIIPLSTKPDVLIHSKEVSIAGGSLVGFGASLEKMSWR